MVFKVQDDPTVNVSEIVIFMRQIWWSAGKREDFGKRREKKNEIERQWRLRSQYEN